MAIVAERRSLRLFVYAQALLLLLLLPANAATDTGALPSCSCTGSGCTKPGNDQNTPAAHPRSGICPPAPMICVMIRGKWQLSRLRLLRHFSTCTLHTRALPGRPAARACPSLLTSTEAHYNQVARTKSHDHDYPSINLNTLLIVLIP